MKPTKAGGHAEGFSRRFDRTHENLADECDEDGNEKQDHDAGRKGRRLFSGIFLRDAAEGLLVGAKRKDKAKEVAADQQHGEHRAQGLKRGAAALVLGAGDHGRHEESDGRNEEQA